jgi:hypothetical protein
MAKRSTNFTGRKPMRANHMLDLMTWIGMTDAEIRSAVSPASSSLLPIGTWVRAWTTSRREPGGGEVLGWVEGYGTERDHFTGAAVGPTLKVRNYIVGADVRPDAVYEVLGPVEVAELFARLMGAYNT